MRMIHLRHDTRRYFHLLVMFRWKKQRKQNQNRSITLIVFNRWIPNYVWHMNFLFYPSLKNQCQKVRKSRSDSSGDDYLMVHTFLNTIFGGECFFSAAEMRNQTTQITQASNVSSAVCWNEEWKSPIRLVL